MKMKTLIVSIVLAIAAALPAAANDDPRFACKTIVPLLGCKTVYVGERSPEEAIAYVEDLERAAEIVMDKFPTVSDLQYIAGKGYLVLTVEPGVFLTRADLSRIADVYVNLRLRIDYVVAKRPGPYGTATATKRMTRDIGGRSRYYALSRVDFQSDTVRTATASERSHLRNTFRSRSDFIVVN